MGAGRGCTRPALCRVQMHSFFNRSIALVKTNGRTLSDSWASRCVAAGPALDASARHAWLALPAALTASLAVGPASALSSSGCSSGRRSDVPSREAARDTVLTALDELPDQRLDACGKRTAASWLDDLPRATDARRSRLLPTCAEGQRPARAVCCSCEASARCFRTLP